MSDSYTQFSFLVTKLKVAEVNWLYEILQLNISADSMHSDPNPQIDIDLKRLREMLTTEARGFPSAIEYWPDFEWHWEPNGDLWISSPDQGSGYNAALLMHAFIAKFRPKEVFSFGVSFSSNKMEVDEFGGCDWIITSMDMINTSDISTMVMESLTKRRWKGKAYCGIEITAKPTTKKMAKANLIAKVDNVRAGKKRARR